MFPFQFILFYFKEKDKQYRREQRQMKSQEKRTASGEPPSRGDKNKAEQTRPSTASTTMPDSNGFKMPLAPPKQAPAKKAAVAPPPGYPGPRGNGEEGEAVGQPAAKRPRMADEDNNSALTEEQRKKLRTVFLSNLDFEVDEVEIRDLLSSTGPVVEVRLVKHPNGKSKGFAFVEFATVREASEWIHGQQVPGCPWKKPP